MEGRAWYCGCGNLTGCRAMGWLASLMGGPASYTSEYLREVHAHLDIARRPSRR
jgi:hypothetical protein